MKSTLSLFKALPLDPNSKVSSALKSGEALSKYTLEKGFIFSPEIIDSYQESELIKIAKSFGLTAEQANNSFHKSWDKVKDADLKQLVLEQVIHYFTTYGFEKLGIYSNESVYIPNERLEIPEFKEEVNLVIIRGYTKSELKEKLLKLLVSGIALKEDTIEDVVDIALFVDINEKEIETIRNKEVTAIMYDYLNLIPENPVEFLRYVIYKSTNKTLLIKSPGVIEEIKTQNSIGIIKLFKDYEKRYSLNGLATIFYRFKPLFLALRTNAQMKRIVNRIRRLAKKYHRPMVEDYLNCITAKIKTGTNLSQVLLKKRLGEANVFRKIRLAYALQYRTKDNDSILYRIRNGKGFATDFQASNTEYSKRILQVVIASIVEDVSKNVKDKKIYIPGNVNYALPATEKQFVDNLPSGSYVSVPEDMIAGIHWNDIKGHRVDLDLSMMNPENGKIGWDADYRTEDKSILFSGDMTSAGGKNGASELFYIRKQKEGSFIVFVNYYNFEEGTEVPYSIIVAKENTNDLKMNYMIDPNNVVATIKSKIDQRQKILGLLVVKKNESRYYFTEINLGRSITACYSEASHIEQSRKYLFSFYENAIMLKDILIGAGAEITDDKEGCDIDLSLESLEKDSIVNLII